MTNRATTNTMLAVYFTVTGFVFLWFAVTANMQEILMHILIGTTIVAFVAAIVMVWKAMPDDDKEKKVELE